MTTISASSRTTSTAAAGTATVLVAATLTTLFAHGWPEVISMVALIVVAAVVVYGVFVPRALDRGRTGGTALTLGVLAAVAVVPAFWSGLPLVLGVAAMIVGNAGRTAAKGGGTSIAGLVLGALATLGYLSIYVVEGLAGNTGFLLG